MAGHFLETFVRPRSIAVVGASDSARSVGGRVLANLLEGGFAGTVIAVNPHRGHVRGVQAIPSLRDLHEPVDLASVATRAERVPAVIDDAAAAGVRRLVIHATGIDRGSELEHAIRARARDSGIRLLGPNSMGLMAPGRNVNLSFGRNPAARGRLALVSQSGALCTALLDWARTHHVGFSLVASIGTAADIDIGDVLDYLAVDPETDHILVYLEGVRNARAFMSALRAAGRAKPVMVVKGGRFAETAPAAQSHAGALIGRDDVFDTAMARAGAIRLQRIDQLFSAGRMLPARRRLRGNRLAIVTDGGGPGVIAADRTVESGLRLAGLADTTTETLAGALPPHGSGSNPVDIREDADPDHYRAALQACLRDPGVDCVLALVTPQGMADSRAIARAVVDVSSGTRKPLAVCWMGESSEGPARSQLLQAGIPQFDTPEDAVDALSSLARYRDNQKLLMQVPGPHAPETPPDTADAERLVNGALADGRDALDTLEARRLLAAFGIASTSTVAAETPEDAAAAARAIGFPVVVKVDSPDITHKAVVGGVVLDLRSMSEVRTAARRILHNVGRLRPGARVGGLTVEPMLPARPDQEVFVGVARDPVFGPVVSLGIGGTLVELTRRYAVALPPLNELIVRDLMFRSGVHDLLQLHDDEAAVDPTALIDVLLCLSNLVCSLPRVREIDINPLRISPRGVVVLDAHVSLDPAAPEGGTDHLAIPPYPDHLIRRTKLRDGTPFNLRPIRPEDAEMEQRFVRSLSTKARFFRFMRPLDELTPAMLARFTQIDYDREMAFVAVAVDEHGEETEEMGVARYAIDADRRGCEFAVVIADAWSRRGLARLLLGEVMTSARQRGVERIHGEVLAENTGMLRLMRDLGFRIDRDPDDEAIRHVHRSLSANRGPGVGDGV